MLGLWFSETFVSLFYYYRRKMSQSASTEFKRKVTCLTNLKVSVGLMLPKTSVYLSISHSLSCSLSLSLPLTLHTPTVVSVWAEPELVVTYQFYRNVSSPYVFLRVRIINSPFILRECFYCNGENESWGMKKVEGVGFTSLPQVKKDKVLKKWD